MLLRYALATSWFSVIAIAQSVNSGKDWEHKKPEEAEYSSKRLDALKGYLATIDTTAMMAVHKGKVIFEYGDVTRQGMLTSVCKSLLTLLYGKYVANGKINLEATMEELGIDDVGGLLPIEKRAKARQLITARSGVFHKSASGSDSLSEAPPRGTQEPGSYFLYSNWNFHVASYVFEKQTGLDIFNVLQKDLAEPIGMQDFDRALQNSPTAAWKAAGDATLSKYPDHFMWLTTRYGPRRPTHVAERQVGRQTSRTRRLDQNDHVARHAHGPN